MSTARSARLYKRTLSLHVPPAAGSHFRLPSSFPVGCLGSHPVSHGVLWAAPQEGEMKGSRHDPVPKARHNPGKLPPKSSCASHFCLHLHLSPVLFISTKGNPCSRSSRHMDLVLFKPYKAVQKLSAWGMIFLIHCEPHSAGSSTHEDASLTNVSLFFLLSQGNQQ